MDGGAPRQAGGVPRRRHGLGIKDPIKSHFDRTVFVQLAEFSKRLTITRPSLPCTFTLAVEDRPKCKLLLALYPKPPSSDRTAGSSLRARLVGDDRGQFKPESAGEYASLLHPLPGRGTNATSVKAQPAQEPELVSSVAPEQEAAAGGNMYQQMIDILSQISPRTVEVGKLILHMERFKRDQSLPAAFKNPGERRREEEADEEPSRILKRERAD